MRANRRARCSLRHFRIAISRQRSGRFMGESRRHRARRASAGFRSCRFVLNPVERRQARCGIGSPLAGHGRGAEIGATSPGRCLRVSAAVAFARRQVVPLLPAFGKAHPALTVEAIVDHSNAGLIGKHITIALRVADSTALAASGPASLRMQSAARERAGPSACAGLLEILRSSAEKMARHRLPAAGRPSTADADGAGGASPGRGGR